MSTITIAALFLSMSQTYNLPEGLLSAVCWVESAHDTTAFHRDDGLSNSVGICQVQLGTARVLGFKGSEARLQDVQTNVRFAARYLRKQLDRYSGDSSKAIAAYNAGSYRLNAKGQIRNRRYVAKVLKAWKEER